MSRRRTTLLLSGLALAALVVAIRLQQLPSLGVVQLGQDADQTVRLANRSDRTWRFHVASGSDAADVELPPQTRARCDVAEPPDGRIAITVTGTDGAMRAKVTVDAAGLGAHEVVVTADGTVSGGTASLSTLAGL